MEALPSGTSRLIVLSTPRSGNTWLRMLLTELCDSQPLAVHHPTEIPWATLPDRLVVQLHWNPTAAFRTQIEVAGIVPVTIVRHPLDVLISILQFAPRDGLTGLWLEGRGGDETILEEATPTSPQFLEYATSERVAELLSVTPGWLESGTISLRYEDLVARPVSSLSKLMDDLNEVPRVRIAEAVSATGLNDLKKKHPGRVHHFWKGEVGLWRKLLPASVAEVIADAHSGVFELLSYDTEPAAELSADQAEANWRTLTAERQ